MYVAHNTNIYNCFRDDLKSSQRNIWYGIETLFVLEKKFGKVGQAMIMYANKYTYLGKAKWQPFNVAFDLKLTHKVILSLKTLVCLHLTRYKVICDVDSVCARHTDWSVGRMWLKFFHNSCSLYVYLMLYHIHFTLFSTNIHHFPPPIQMLHIIVTMWIKPIYKRLLIYFLNTKRQGRG